ncbi:hypothetical protein ACJX0J_015351, partial [Zea mays]
GPRIKRGAKRNRDRGNHIHHGTKRHLKHLFLLTPLFGFEFNTVLFFGRIDENKLRQH